MPYQLSRTPVREVRYPLMAGQAGYQHWCAGWPLPAQPWHLTRGSNDLLLVGHRYATVTLRRISGDAHHVVVENLAGATSRPT